MIFHRNTYIEEIKNISKILEKIEKKEGEEENKENVNMENSQQNAPEGQTSAPNQEEPQKEESKLKIFLFL